MEHVEQEVILAYRTRCTATNGHITSAHLQARVRTWREDDTESVEWRDVRELPVSPDGTTGIVTPEGE